MAKNEQTKDRKTELVEAAAGLLAQHGEAGFNLRDVANAVGIKLASLQYHFPTKADLVSAILQRTLETYLEEIEADLAALGGDPETQLEAAFRTLSRLDELDDVEVRLEIHLWSMAQNDPSVHAALQSYHRFYIGKLTSLIVAARPEIGPDQARKRAVLIASMQEGSMLFTDQGTTGVPHKAIREQVFRVTLEIAMA